MLQGGGDESLQVDSVFNCRLLKFTLRQSWVFNSVLQSCHDHWISKPWTAASGEKQGWVPASIWSYFHQLINTEPYWFLSKDNYLMYIVD